MCLRIKEGQKMSESELHSTAILNYTSLVRQFFSKDEELSADAFTNGICNNSMIRIFVLMIIF